MAGNRADAWILIPCNRAAVSKASARFLPYPSDVAMVLTYVVREKELLRK